MRVLSLASVLTAALAFVPQSKGPTRHGVTTNDASVQDYLDRIFQGRSAKKEIDLPSEEEIMASSVKTEKKTKQDTSKTTKHADKWISDFFNNFEPIHGFGSAHDDLQQIRKDQKQMLQERKSSAEKEVLKQKYQDHEIDHHGEIPMIAFDPAELNKKEDDAMYLDEKYSIEVPSFHIEEAADNLMEKMNTWMKKRVNPDDTELTP